MTKKADVDLSKYEKAPRKLSDKMMGALLDEKGALTPILEAVKTPDGLRLDIRDGSLSVYYRGGSLIKVAHRVAPWKMEFNTEYFRGASEWLETLPNPASSVAQARQWVEGFAKLREVMDQWWKDYDRAERDDCQMMAAANSPRAPYAAGDYLVLDIEYQWAHRRFDLVAARRNPTGGGDLGWRRPHLVFVEVKSKVAACGGDSGLAEHLNDYVSIVDVDNDSTYRGIKTEFEEVIAQKRRLGLFDDALPFESFSVDRPELLFVLVAPGVTAERASTHIRRAKEVLVGKGTGDSVRLMQLAKGEYDMTSAKAIPLDQLKL